MTATTAPPIPAPTTTGPITEAGVYDMPADRYHGDPVPAGSLSVSGARKLMPPSCPALFKYERDNPPAPKRHFDIGHAAHKLVLGVGPKLVRIDADEWRTNAIKAQVAAVREAGDVPLKPDEYDQVHAMAAALRQHQLAAALLNPDHGVAEQSAFWVDDATGVWRRCRFDWLGRWPVDYKTAQSVEPGYIRKAMHDYGYHQQSAWYGDGARALGIADDATPFMFIFQMKDPPYLVTVAQSEPDAMRDAHVRNRQAIAKYRECVENDDWPGYTTDVAHIALPRWVTTPTPEETW